LKDPHPESGVRCPLLSYTPRLPNHRGVLEKNRIFGQSFVVLEKKYKKYKKLLHGLSLIAALAKG
jgi:hypothetical protein